MFKLTFRLALVTAIFSSFTACASSEVTIYSVYDAKRLGPVFQPFTDKTGIKVNIVDGDSKTLINKIAEEGENTAADLHLDKDLVYNSYAQDKGIYQPFNSKRIENSIPKHLIETNKNWFTFLYRARVIMYNKNKVNPSELSTLEDLASSKWQGRLCLRTSTNSYNQALGAYVVKHNGEKKALSIFKGWVNNFATAPMKNDREVINSVAEGKCDVGLANTYYLAPMIEANPEFATRAFFPDQNGAGAHVNGIAIGLTKYAKNVKAATLLMEYLASVEVQTPLARAFEQYPANKNAPMSETLKGFGAFKEDLTNVSEIGSLVDKANAIMIDAQYN